MRRTLALIGAGLIGFAAACAATSHRRAAESGPPGMVWIPVGEFTWKVTDRGRSRQFQGAATFDKDVLALAPADQPPMVGMVAWKDDDHFQFKALGAPPDDPGLVFGK